MTERCPADMAQREAALDPARSFIVQAPAGSGKTTLLVQRFLRLLCQVEQPERVLAITFTRKAAAEMRRRIADALGLARRGMSGDERAAMAPDKRATLALAEDVFRRDQAREPGERWELDRYPARLRVMTFDALCLELASRLPVLSQFGSVPEPTEEDEPLLLEAALRTLERFYEPGDPVADEVAVLLDFVDNDWPRCRRLLAEMLKSRGQWRLDPVRPPDRAELDRALAYSIRHFLDRIAARLPDGVGAEMAPLGAFAGARLVEAGADSPITALAGRETLPGTDDPAGWRGIAELLLTADGRKWRGKWDRNQGIPPGKAGKPFKDRLKTVAESLAGDQRLRELLATVRLVPDGYDAGQARVLRALHAVLVNALAEMRVVVSEHGQADFTEIALRAEQALGDADSPSELLMRVDYALEHLLVDEFQDTSWSQYRLLARLTEGWQDGDGRSLFLVGDPMQSIYRFRDAEVGLFVDVFERRRLAGVALEPLTLSVNFRSSADLVAWFNGAFETVMPARSDAAVGAVAYTPARPGPDAQASGVAAANTHPAASREEEGRRVAELVARLRASHPDETVAVLVRSRTHLKPILPRLHALLERPFLGQKLERLNEHPDVCDLMALTRALLHPADRVAWLAVLRAPWCGLSREALHCLCERAGERSIPEALDEPPGFADRRDDLALARASDVLREALDARHGRPLRDWIETTWLALGGPESTHDALGLAAVRACLDEIEDLDEGGDLPDPADLEQALARRFVPADPLADDRVQVMTMHQAKGLEFDHVILPGLERFGKRDDDPLQIWHDLPGPDTETLTLAAVMDAPDSPKGSATAYRFVRELEKERHDYELSRLLYVACTRAKRSLHLFAAGFEGAPDRRSLLHRLWDLMEADFDTVPDAATEDDGPPVEPRDVLRRLPAEWRVPEPPPAVRGEVPEEAPGAEPEPVEYQWVSEPGRIAGTVVHEYLRRIAADGVEVWDAGTLERHREAIARRLARHGLDPGALEATTDRVLRALGAALDDDTGRWILAMRDSARNEYQLCRIECGRLKTVILDRTFVDDGGTRWIIDYKAGERRGDVDEFMDQEVERYRAQLEDYARVMHALEDGARPIRVALYYPLLGAFRDWPVDFV